MGVVRMRQLWCPARRSQAASGGEATLHRKRPGNEHCDRERARGVIGGGGILFARMRITIYYFLARNILCIIHTELLDRAQLTEQLSHIQSELAAGTQIHYNTKCAVYDLCREVKNKGCMCLPQLIIGIDYISM